MRLRRHLYLRITFEEPLWVTGGCDIVSGVHGTEEAAATKARYHAPCIRIFVLFEFL